MIKALNALPVSSSLSSVTIVDDPGSAQPQPDYNPWQFSTLNGFVASDVDQSISLHHTLKYLKFDYHELEHLQAKRTSQILECVMKRYRLIYIGCYKTIQCWKLPWIIIRLRLG